MSLNYDSKRMTISFGGKCSTSRAAISSSSLSAPPEVAETDTICKCYGRKGIRSWDGGWEESLTQGKCCRYLTKFNFPSFC